MATINTDEHWMIHALELAHKAEEQGEVPVGAVLVKDGEILAEGWNQTICSHDPTAHAEIEALRKAAQKLSNYRLPDTTLYVTLEPCPMCVGAMIHARVSRVVFGAHDPKTGAVDGAIALINDPTHNHQIEVSGGVLAEQCGQKLVDFFKNRRRKAKNKSE